jgi:hypothetical protein
MPATFNKFNPFVEHLAEGVHNLATGTLKVMLTNSAPAAANAVKADITEIAAGSGYTAGGATSTQVSSAQTSGTYRLITGNVSWTASGGTIGPFRYPVVYNDTPSSPADPLIGYYDYGSNLTLNSGDQFTVSLDQVNGLLSLA